MVELLGIAASVAVVGSFLMHGERAIRISNCLGAGLFVLYGILCGAWSVSICNGILIGIQFYRVRKLGGREDGERAEP